MSMLKIAMVQRKAVPNRPDLNLELGLTLFRKAAEQGVDLVLFPELWSNGYAPPFDGAFDDPWDPRYDKERAQWLSHAFGADSPFVQSFRRTAAELHTGVVITCLTPGSSAPQNSAYVIGKSGELLTVYSKVHTCDFSLEGLLQSGNEFRVCDFEGIKLGVMICFDREFPESARVLMLQGAEVILVPNACPMDPARLNQLSTRAFENMTAVVMANYPGHGWGHSCAFSPMVYDSKGHWQDNTLCMSDDVSEQFLTVSIDLDQLRQYRREEVWGNRFRKTKAYRSLL